EGWGKRCSIINIVPKDDVPEVNPLITRGHKFKHQSSIPDNGRGLGDIKGHPRIVVSVDVRSRNRKGANATAGRNGPVPHRATDLYAVGFHRKAGRITAVRAEI